MPKPRSRTKRKTVPASILVALIGGVVTIVATLISRYDSTRNPSTPSPTPVCMTSNDILVKINVLGKDENGMDILLSGGTTFITLDTTVFFQADISSADNLQVPKFECTWTDTDIATEGALLSKSGCKVGYKNGSDSKEDAISLQLTQANCSPLAPYLFFVSPKDNQ